MQLVRPQRKVLGMIDKWHVYPINDLRDHDVEGGVGCWCKPLEDEEGIIVHNSMDRREGYETGKKLYS